MKTRLFTIISIAAAGLAMASVAHAADRARYALVLADPPLADVDTTGGKESAQARRLAAASGIESSHRQLRAAAADRKLTVLGESRVLLNAIYVVADRGDAASLRDLPGVVNVVEMPPIKRHMVKALDLVRAPAAWQALGGADRSGAGVGIAVLDTGIDHQHPAFQDPSLALPAGYPRCRERDCAFTNNKVIAARSYVDLLVLPGDPVDTRPDDLSARDRVGHGTAVAMVAGGARHDSPLGPMSGVAPKAFLGNYKIFGSPGVNDVTFDNVVIQALEDAITDGMGIAVLSLGRPADWTPSDAGSICGRNPGVACDPRADAVERASRFITVVVSAGNDGDIGLRAPSFNTIHSPGTAPSVLTVGATTNSQRYFSTVQLANGAIAATPILFGDGPIPAAPVRTRAIDVKSVQDEGLACEPIAAGALSGAVAVVQQGDCTFATKVNNAQRAGAVAVLIERTNGSNFLFPMTGLKETGIPAALIGSADGIRLRDAIANQPGTTAELLPALRPFPQDADEVAYFSSYGPSIDGILKPEVTAPGASLYMATQSFDPNGDMYSPDGFTSAQGTSFSAPIAAGAAALFLQRLPSASPAIVKSAVVNTADPQILDYDDDGTFAANSIAMGAGKVNAEAVAKTNLTVVPSVISIGFLGNTLPQGSFRVNNHGSDPVTITLAVQPRGSAPSARVVLGETSFTLAGGTNRLVAVRLEGTRPAPGLYEGVIAVSGGTVPLRIPYLYAVGDGAAVNAVPIRGFDWLSTPGGRLRLSFKLIDRYGVPVANAPVTFRSTLGNGEIIRATARTDEIGIAEAEDARAGSLIGPQEFTAEAGGLTLAFFGRARQQPAIRTAGVVNAASGQEGRGVAPGSYASIFGTALSDSLRVANSTTLPYSLAGVSVSFDVPGRPLSYAGRLHFVSEGQVNVQVPWELQGLNTAVMKVSIGEIQTALYNVPLNDYSPAAFEFTDPGSGRLLAAALDGASRLITTATPVRKGEVAQIYANGLGPVANAPATGEPASTTALSPTRVTPSITVGGRPAEVLFSGLAPGFVGLYQINVRLAADTPSGVQPVVITMEGVTSKTSNLAVE